MAGLAARPTSPTRPRSGSTTRRGGDFEPGNRAGRQLHYGIREHESAAISNGLSLSKLRPSWSTYLIFSDYARPAIRLSALMELPVIHIFTHDSIGLGEDGPTHQPVEHLASLRAIPGLNVIRPCDANEVAEAWRVTIEADHQPTALVLTRQNVPVLDRSRYAPRRGPAPRRLRARRRRGRRAGADPDRDRQRGRARGRARTSSSPPTGVRSRVVSLPSFQLFDQQDQAYRDAGAAARRSTRADLDRGGLDARLGPLRRPGGGEDRHAHLRLLGAAQGRAQRVRVHAREGRRDGARAARRERGA